MSEQKFTYLVRLSLHIGDYHRRTSHLSASENGAVLCLICHYWSNSGLPTDDDQLARIAKMSLAEWRRHKPVLQGLFEPGWRLPWLEAELQDATELAQRRSESGKEGNRKRWAHRHADADRLADDTRSHRDRSAIASGSLPPPSPHLEDSQQEGIRPSEKGVIGSSRAVVPLRGGRA
jgi:uncharacterized protein YdaU (DUF1376 family)